MVALVSGEMILHGKKLVHKLSSTAVDLVLPLQVDMD